MLFVAVVVVTDADGAVVTAVAAAVAAAATAAAVATSYDHLACYIQLA